MKLPHFSLLAILPSLASAATQSIASLPAYQSQRSCAIPCFWNGDPNNINAGDSLGVALQCCSDRVSCKDRAQDACFCRADLRPSAVSWLSRCVGGYCSNEVDVASAVGVYDEYCADKKGVAPTQTGTGTGVVATGGAGSRGTGGTGGPAATGVSSGSDGVRGIPWMVLVLGGAAATWTSLR